ASASAPTQSPWCSSLVPTSRSVSVRDRSCAAVMPWRVPVKETIICPVPQGAAFFVTSRAFFARECHGVRGYFSPRECHGVRGYFSPRECHGVRGYFSPRECHGVQENTRAPMPLTR